MNFINYLKQNICEHKLKLNNYFLIKTPMNTISKIIITTASGIIMALYKNIDEFEYSCVNKSFVFVKFVFVKFKLESKPFNFVTSFVLKLVGLVRLYIGLVKPNDLPNIAVLGVAVSNIGTKYSLVVDFEGKIVLSVVEVVVVVVVLVEVEVVEVLVGFDVLSMLFKFKINSYSLLTRSFKYK